LGAWKRKPTSKVGKTGGMSTKSMHQPVHAFSCERIATRPPPMKKSAFSPRLSHPKVRYPVWSVSQKQAVSGAANG